MSRSTNDALAFKHRSCFRCSLSRPSLFPYSRATNRRAQTLQYQLDFGSTRIRILRKENCPRTVGLPSSTLATLL